MIPKDISQAKNPDMRGALAAMLRAAEMARQVAIQTNTGIIVAKDGKPVLVTADELRKRSI
jgi:hypothetical protein